MFVSVGGSVFPEIREILVLLGLNIFDGRHNLLDHRRNDGIAKLEVVLY